MVESLQKIDLTENKIVGDKKKRYKGILLILVGIVLIILIIFTPLLVLSLPLVPQIKKLASVGQETYQAAKSQDLIATEEKLINTQTVLKQTYQSYKRLAVYKWLPVLGAYYKDGDYMFQAATAEIEGAKVILDAVVPYADVLGLKGKGTFTGGTAEDRIIKIVQTLNEITPKLVEVKKNLDFAREQTDKVDATRYPVSIQGKKVRENIVKIKDLVSSAALAVNDAGPVLEVLPKILGYPTPYKYLLIMQNDGELRATGGFMTAYSIIKLDSGRVIPEKSDDIYSLDKKNTKKIKAPEAIAKYLFSADLKTGIVPYWYIRDMNLSPDFKVSMETFKKSYDELPSEAKVDGIIAIDTKILKDLLTMLGPIEVPEYGRFSMDKDPRCHDIPQVVCEIELIIDTPIPGIKASRKDVLGPLMKTILSGVFKSPSAMWPRILKLAIEEINQKHVLFYYPDEKVQIASEKLNAGGRIKTVIGDYLHINDSNFGGAKSNLFVSEEVEQKIDIKADNTIEKTITLTYSNPEKMDNCNLERATGLCLNGILRNYLRVYVPEGSKMIEARGSETEVTSYNDLGKTVFEGFFTLRGNGGKAKVIITYQLPFKYDPKLGYNLLIQKQAGTTGNHYTVYFKDKKEEFDLITDKEIKF